MIEELLKLSTSSTENSDDVDEYERDRFNRRMVRIRKLEGKRLPFKKPLEIAGSGKDSGRALTVESVQGE